MTHKQVSIFFFFDDDDDDDDQLQRDDGVALYSRRPIPLRNENNDIIFDENNEDDPYIHPKTDSKSKFVSTRRIFVLYDHRRIRISKFCQDDDGIYDDDDDDDDDDALDR